MKKIIISQFIVLLIGTLFAWFNFIRELVAWLNYRSCEVGCSLSGAVVNPFLTPCFYGMLFFTIAFILSVIMLKNRKNV
ncbi:MAG: hypothetical protein NTY11_02530 [Candidatus Parcubacteria bacterium]|nr:hypothetical protein [Candidatus Parcubacteria bacterium]